MSPTTGTGDFVVMQTKPDQRDPMALAKALAAIRKTPLQDQIVGAKSSWGFVAERLAEAEARDLSQRLTAAGIAAAAVPASTLVILPEAQPMKQATVGWADGLVLVAAAGVTITTTTKHVEEQGPTPGQRILKAGIMLTTGLPISIGPKKKTIETEHSQSELFFYADLLYRNPLRRLRIDAQKFDYSFLKERRLTHVMGNFKLLLEAVIQAAPQAWRNHGLNILREGRPVNLMGYVSLTDLERETRWLLTLQDLI